jgi:MoxR-like ATPase
MYFDDLGIYGWDSIEPLILSAILSDLSVLLIGDIGTNKTEGAKTIAQAVLNPGIEFRHYEVPTLNFDDLVGFLNPKSLAKGSLDFVPTPFSIWEAEAALFDEINRANPFLQSKLHELIRTRKLMGLPTKLKVVFSAVNPPETYQTGYMDLAIASRFVSVQVPNIGEIKASQLDKILSRNGQPPKKSTLKALLKQAGACQFKKKDLEKAQALVKRVAGDLAETEIIFNPRQLKMMVKLLVGGHALGKVTGQSSFSDSETNTAYIEAVIPEVQGIVRSRVNQEMVHGTIRTIVKGFSLEDPLIMAKTLEELAQAEISDSLAWVTAMKKMADQEDNPKVLTKVITKVRDLTRKEVIDRELGEKLIHQLATNLTTQTLLTEDVPVTGLLERVNQVVTSI